MSLGKESDTRSQNFYFPFREKPSAPTFALPAGACDSQFHVFGPEDRYPPKPDAAYTMPSANLETALRLHGLMGISRGVIVQPTTYGADHSITVDALKIAGPNYRGCANAAVLRSASDAELAALDAAGIHGVRFSRAGLGSTSSEAEMARDIAKARELGWYLKVQPDVRGIAANIAPFETVEAPLVIDHLGRPETLSLDDPSVEAVRRQLRRGDRWVMISMPEKMSKAGAPWHDLLPIVHSYLDTAPDRVIWGSDWPHPLSKVPAPDDGLVLDFVSAVARDARELQAILVDTPAALFNFA